MKLMQVTISKIFENKVLKESQFLDDAGGNANKFHASWSHLPFHTVEDLKTEINFQKSCPEIGISINDLK